jgi:hypothetical protein
MLEHPRESNLRIRHWAVAGGDVWLQSKQDLEGDTSYSLTVRGVSVPMKADMISILEDLITTIRNMP